MTGDVDALTDEIAADPALVRARSVAPHRATLLHYVAANGIADELQRQVANADAVAAVLVAAGAEVDAPCAAYGADYQTTLDLLVSSDHPCEAGVTGRLVRLLCAAGAAVNGRADNGSPLATALCFAILDGVDALIACGARTDNAIFAAAAGNTEAVATWVERSAEAAARPVPAFLPLAADRRTAAEQARVFACMCGRIDVATRLVRQGVDVNASPPGSHWTATPLHTAAGQGQPEVVALLLAHGADPTLRDARYQGTALDWSRHARGPRKAGAAAAATLLARRG